MPSSSPHRFVHPLLYAALSLILSAALYSCSSKGPQEAPRQNAVKNGKDLPTSASLYRPDAGEVPSGPPKPAFQKPDVVKGIYLTAWSAGSRTKMAKVMKMMDETELNAVVIDVRDSGDMYFPTGIKLADEVVGKKTLAVVKPQRLMEMLSKHKVWPVARIACFRDQWVPLKHKDRAVLLADGQPWHDRSKHYWLDPYDERNWEYIAETVEYAMKIGFPEIQLDYVRFPSEGKSATQRFPNQAKYEKEHPGSKPEDVIAAFSKYIGDKVREKGAVYSADIFGIISSTKTDQGIGQFLEKVVEPFDLVSPMVYPSHFAKGEYGIKDPNAVPYTIITKSLRDYKKRVPNKPLRPWLQDFDHYGPKEIRAQIKAANDLGYKDWLLWNAGNKYTVSALAKEGPATTKVASTGTPAPVSAPSQ